MARERAATTQTATSGSPTGALRPGMSGTELKAMLSGAYGYGSYTNRLGVGSGTNAVSSTRGEAHGQPKGLSTDFGSGAYGAGGPLTLEQTLRKAPNAPTRTPLDEAPVFRTDEQGRRIPVNYAAHMQVWAEEDAAKATNGNQRAGEQPSTVNMPLMPGPADFIPPVVPVITLTPATLDTSSNQITETPPIAAVQTQETPLREDKKKKIREQSTIERTPEDLREIGDALASQAITVFNAKPNPNPALGEIVWRDLSIAPETFATLKVVTEAVKETYAASKSPENKEGTYPITQQELAKTIQSVITDRPIANETQDVAAYRLLVAQGITIMAETLQMLLPNEIEAQTLGQQKRLKFAQSLLAFHKKLKPEAEGGTLVRFGDEFKAKDRTITDDHLNYWIAGLKEVLAPAVRLTRQDRRHNITVDNVANQQARQVLEVLMSSYADIQYDTDNLAAFNEKLLAKQKRETVAATATRRFAAHPGVHNGSSDVHTPFAVFSPPVEVPVEKQSIPTTIGESREAATKRAEALPNGGELINIARDGEEPRYLVLSRQVDDGSETGASLTDDDLRHVRVVMGRPEVHAQIQPDTHLIVTRKQTAKAA